MGWSSATVGIRDALPAWGIFGGVVMRAGYGAWRVGVNLGLFALLLLLAPSALAAPIAILAFGDSLTAGFGLAEAEIGRAHV